MMEKMPLVLVPGLLCDAALWAHQTEHLKDIADISVAETRKDASLAEMASRLLAEAPDRFALAGLSMGGYISLEVMQQAPERIVKLALLDTQARADDAAKRKQREELIAMAEVGEFRGATQRLMPLFLHPDRLQDRALTESITAMTQRVGKDAFVRQQRALMGRRDLRPYLGEIRVPTMILCGRQDSLTPLDRHEEIAAAIPGSRLCIVEDCGHMSTMERPSAVTALMRDWLLHDR